MYFSLKAGAMAESELEKIAAVGGVGRHDEMAGGSENRERDQRQQHRVKPGHDRRARDPGIAEHLRDVHRRERHPRDDVAHRPGAAERAKAREKL
jgi:hypothetical protein